MSYQSHLCSAPEMVGCGGFARKCLNCIKKIGCQVEIWGKSVTFIINDFPSSCLLAEIT